jgi:hypothetical protein
LENGKDIQNDEQDQQNLPLGSLLGLQLKPCNSKLSGLVGNTQNKADISKQCQGETSTWVQFWSPPVISTREHQ